MPWQCIEEYEDTGTGYGLKRTYVYGNNIDEVLELEIVGVAKYYYHTNVQGNTVALTDEDGDIVEKFTYDVYGRLTAAWAWDGSAMVQVLDGDLNGNGTVTTPPEPGDEDPDGFFDKEYLALSVIDNVLLFQSRRRDTESGLYYFRNRQYDPVHGRFLSRDPEGYKDSYCLYQFVNNNPVNYVDPYGLHSFHIHFDLGLDLPIVGKIYCGTWDGDFIWSCTDGKESSSINPLPGFSGLTSFGVSASIAGVGIGYSITLTESHVNKSHWEDCILDGEGECGIGRLYWVELEVVITAKAVATPVVIHKKIGSHTLFDLCPCRPKS